MTFSGLSKIFFYCIFSIEGLSWAVEYNTSLFYKRLIYSFLFLLIKEAKKKNTKCTQGVYTKYSKKIKTLSFLGFSICHHILYQKKCFKLFGLE